MQKIHTKFNSFINEHNSNKCEFCDYEYYSYNKETRLMQKAIELVKAGFDDSYVEAKLYGSNVGSMKDIKEAIEKAKKHLSDKH